MSTSDTVRRLAELDAKSTHSDGDRIACPHCGHTMRDLWDYEWGSREIINVECGECEKSFALVMHVSVSYTAKPLLETTDGPDA